MKLENSRKGKWEICYFAYFAAYSVLCLSLYDTPGLAPIMNVLFWGPGDFPVRIPRGLLKIVIQEVLWSLRGSYTAMWSLPFTNIKWHSDPWPVTLTSQPIRRSTNFMTLIPSLTFAELLVVSMDYLQRLWHVSRERLPFRTPGSVPLFRTCLSCNCWDQISRTCRVFTWLFTLNTPRYFLHKQIADPSQITESGTSLYSLLQITMLNHR